MTAPHRPDPLPDDPGPLHLQPRAAHGRAAPRSLAAHAILGALALAALTAALAAAAFDATTCRAGASLAQHLAAGGMP